MYLIFGLFGSNVSGVHCILFYLYLFKYKPFPKRYSNLSLPTYLTHKVESILNPILRHSFLLLSGVGNRFSTVPVGGNASVIKDKTTDQKYLPVRTVWACLRHPIRPHLLENEVVIVRGNAHIVAVLRPEHLAGLDLNATHQLLALPVIEGKASGAGPAAKQVPAIDPCKQCKGV